MTSTNSSEPATSEIYEFRVRGGLSSDWAEWFDGFEISTGDGETLLRGPIRDEAALYGFIAKFRNLGLGLLSLRVCALGEEPQDSRFRE